MLERKSEKQNSQVKANKERNLSQIELNAEKRRLLQEANQETKIRSKSASAVIEHNRYNVPQLVSIILMASMLT